MSENNKDLEKKGFGETIKDAGKKVVGGAKKFVAKTWKFVAGIAVGVVGTVLYTNHKADDEYLIEDEIQTTEEN